MRCPSRRRCPCITSLAGHLDLYFQPERLCARSPAGFHNASLYEALRPAIGPLVLLLQDPEEKTRANAAGALGNLVRNSNALCGDLVRAGALKALMDTACRPEPPRPTTAGGTPVAGDGGSPVTIALFSLGNMCAHRECRDALLQLGVLDVIKQLSGNPDQMLQRYIQRMQTKLQGGAVHGSRVPTAPPTAPPSIPPSR